MRQMSLICLAMFTIIVTFFPDPSAAVQEPLPTIESNTPLNLELPSQYRRPKNSHLKTLNSNPGEANGFHIQQNLADPQSTYYVRNSPVYTVNTSPTQYHVDVYGVALLTAAIIAVDSSREREFKDMIQKSGGHVVKESAHYSEMMGGPLAGSLLAAGYVIAAVIEDGELKTFLKLAFEATLATALVNNALKYATGRCLPTATDDPHKRCSEKQASQYAMPSSHTSTAFSIATVIAETYGRDSKYIAILAYGAATLTAHSRVYTNAHWLSDVIVGAVVGHWVAYSRIHSSDSKGGLTFTPYYSGRSYGIQISYVPRFDSNRGDCNINRTSQGLENCLAKRMPMM